MKTKSLLRPFLLVLGLVLFTDLAYIIADIAENESKVKN